MADSKQLTIGSMMLLGVPLFVAGVAGIFMMAGLPATGIVLYFVAAFLQVKLHSGV